MQHDEIETKAVVGPTRPVIQTWVDLGARVADKAVRTGVAVARDVHDEWKDRVRGSLELVRKLSGHVDGMIDEVIGAAEEGFLGVIRSARKTAADATGVAARAGSTWVGDGQGASEAAVPPN
jgi:hypothetical protein